LQADRSDFRSDGSIELLLPPDRPYQKHIAVYANPDAPQKFVSKRGGNTFLVLAYGANRPSTIGYTLDMELDPTPLDKASHHTDHTDDDPRAFLGITHYTSAKIDPTHIKVQQLLPTIIGGSTNDREKALKIATWVANIPYEYPPSGVGWPTLDQYLSNFKYLECGGHAIMFAVFARAAGIPARRLFWPYIEHKDGKMSFGSHEIAEYFDQAYNGWFPIDATSGPFDQNNKGHWGKVPLQDGVTPTGLVLNAESMDGQEQKAPNFKKNDSLKAASIVMLT